MYKQVIYTSVYTRIGYNSTLRSGLRWKASSTFGVPKTHCPPVLHARVVPICKIRSLFDNTVLVATHLCVPGGHYWKEKAVWQSSKIVMSAHRNQRNGVKVNCYLKPEPAWHESQKSRAFLGIRVDTCNMATCHHHLMKRIGNVLLI